MLNIRFIAAVMLVVLAFVICAVGSLLAKNIETELLVLVSDVENAGSEDEMKKATQNLALLWEEKHDILTLFLEHEQCDQIGIHVSNIEYYGNNADKKNLSFFCFVLIQLLEDMIEEEKISIFNLL